MTLLEKAERAGLAAAFAHAGRPLPTWGHQRQGLLDEVRAVAAARKEAKLPPAAEGSP
jgi:hypothetical protein